MRFVFTLFSLLLLSSAADAQNLTGIWRGYFSSSSGLYRDNIKDDFYKYEIQIDQQKNNGLKGVTFSYKNGVFFAKTGMEGIYAPQGKTLILKETKVFEIKLEGKAEPCLMTCYLDYSRIDKLEVLQGTFISINAKDKGDCGSGKVYLERVTASDFTKEDFLLKKKNDDSFKSKPVITPNLRVQPNTQPPVITTPKRTVPPPQKTDQHHSPAPAVPVGKPKPVAAAPVKTRDKNKQANKGNTTAAARPAAPSKDKPPVISPTEPVRPAITSNWKSDTTVGEKKEPIQRAPIPKVLRDRENNLVKTIYADDENIQVDLYDNGTIDNDTISLYHNNQLVVSNGRLSYSPITYKIKCSRQDSHHELVIVAENLGEIPPNTALMVITIGKTKRYEVFLTSNESRNAKVVIEYRPN